MLALLVVLYIFTVLVLIVAILMQSGRGGGLAGAFGPSFGSGLIFGGKGASEILIKITTGAAILFAILTVVINLYMGRPANVIRSESVIREKARQAAPAAQPGEEERVPQEEQPAPQQGE
jgi:preprotein translocase subunit SecG